MLLFLPIVASLPRPAHPWIASPSDDATFSLGKPIPVLISSRRLREPAQRPRGTEVVSQLDNGPLVVIASHSFPQIRAHPAAVPTDGLVPGRHTLKVGLRYHGGAIDWMDSRNIILTRSHSNAHSLAEDTRPDLQIYSGDLGTLQLNQLSAAKVRLQVIWNGAGPIRIDFERTGFGNHWETLWETVVVNEVFERALGPNFIAQAEFTKADHYQFKLRAVSQDGATSNDYSWLSFQFTLEIPGAPQIELYSPVDGFGHLCIENISDQRVTFHLRDRDSDMVLILYQIGGRGDWFSLHWVPVGFFVGVTIPASCWTNHSDPLTPAHSHEIHFRAYDNRFYSDSVIKVPYTLYHTGAPALSIISARNPSKIEGDDLNLELSIIDANTKPISLLYSHAASSSNDPVFTLLEGVHPAESILITLPASVVDYETNDVSRRILLVLHDGDNSSEALFHYNIRPDVLLTVVSPNTYIGHAIDQPLKFKLHIRSNEPFINLKYAFYDYYNPNGSELIWHDWKKVVPSAWAEVYDFPAAFWKYASHEQGTYSLYIRAESEVDHDFAVFYYCVRQPEGGLVELVAPSNGYLGTFSPGEQPKFNFTFRLIGHHDERYVLFCNFLKSYQELAVLDSLLSHTFEVPPAFWLHQDHTPGTHTVEFFVAQEHSHEMWDGSNVLSLTYIVRGGPPPEEETLIISYSNSVIKIPSGGNVSNKIAIPLSIEFSGNPTFGSFRLYYTTTSSRVLTRYRGTVATGTAIYEFDRSSFNLENQAYGNLSILVYHTVVAATGQTELLLRYENNHIPTIAIVSPDSGVLPPLFELPTQSTGDPNISLHIADADNDPLKLEYAIDADDFQYFQDVSQGASVQVTFLADELAVSPGDHRLRLRVSDGIDVSEPISFKYTVIAGPVLEVLIPKGASWGHSLDRSLRISVHFEEPAVELQYQNLAGQWIRLLNGTISTGQELDVVLPSDAFTIDSGVFAVPLRVLHDGGQQSAIVHVWYVIGTVNNTAPVISFPEGQASYLQVKSSGLDPKQRRIRVAVHDNDDPPFLRIGYCVGNSTWRAWGSARHNETVTIILQWNEIEAHYETGSILQIQFDVFDGIDTAYISFYYHINRPPVLTLNPDSATFSAHGPIDRGFTVIFHINDQDHAYSDLDLKYKFDSANHWSPILYHWGYTFPVHVFRDHLSWSVTHYIHFSLSDGIEETLVSLPYQVAAPTQNSSPTIEVEAPSDMTVRSSGPSAVNRNFRIILADQDDGPLFVTYCFDDSLDWAPEKGYQGSGTYHFHIPAADWEYYLTPGQHWIHFQVNDGIDTHKQVKLVPYKVNRPPTIAFYEAPKSPTFAYQQSGSVHLMFHIEDKDHDAITLQCSYDRSTVMEDLSTGVYPESDAGVIIAWEFTPDWEKLDSPVIGNHTVRFRMVDGYDESYEVSLDFAVTQAIYATPSSAPSDSFYTDFAEESDVTVGAVVGIVLGVIAVIGIGIAVMVCVRTKKTDAAPKIIIP